MLEKILFFRKKIAAKKAEQSNGAAGEDHQTDVREREKALYGNDTLSKQRLYEEWVGREEWILKTEGIPLLLGMDPDQCDINNAAENTTEEMASLWRHAQACATQNLLVVVNLEQEPEEWRVTPVALYQWAMISRVSMPAELMGLAGFVLRAVKKPVYAEKDANTPELNKPKNIILHQKIALGAALALLANQREQFLAETGRVDADKIVAQIFDNKGVWFRRGKPLLSKTAMRDLIEGYLDSIASGTQSKN